MKNEIPTSAVLQVLSYKSCLIDEENQKRDIKKDKMRENMKGRHIFPETASECR
jgi:hypothetical protein